MATVSGRQGKLQRCRILALTADVPSVAPTQPANSAEPHVTMSPKTPTGLETSGIAFFLEEVAGGAGGPFQVKIWKRDPSSLRWALRITISNLPADQWAQVCAMNASELYFEIGGSDPTAGACLVHLEEIGA
jgi:hypothetical protein